MTSKSNAYENIVFPRSKWMFFLVGIILLELVMAYLLPKHIENSMPYLPILFDAIQEYIPIFQKISQETAPYPVYTKSYMFITIVFFPIKIFLIYKWLNSNKRTIYRFLVISPLTDTKPAKGDNFFTDPLREIDDIPESNKQRSMLSRIFLSSIIILFSIIMVLSVPFYNGPESTTDFGKNAYANLVNGNFSMWWSWGMMRVLGAGALLAISTCILRDYWLWFKKLLNS